MESNNQVLNSKKKFWVSLTGYRTLFVLKLLIEKPRSTEDIVEHLKSNEITRKSLSKDTVRITINTLKDVGCKIAKPSSANNHKYVLLYHPFDLYISDEEFNVLLKLRDNLSLELSYDDVFILNDMFEKIKERVMKSFYDDNTKFRIVLLLDGITNKKNNSIQ